MRHASLTLPALAAVVCVASPLAAQEDFTGAFAITDESAPAGFYTEASGVSTLGAWAVAFFPAEGCQSFIDTGLAPESVTIASSSAAPTDYAESETLMFVELPLAGHVSFTVDLLNDATEGAYAQLEIYISGEAYYLTDAGGSTHHLGFDVQAGDTLEFRSVSVSIAPGSSATNLATLTNFAFVDPSAIPEPASFAALLGLCALGLGARRRRQAPV